MFAGLLPTLPTPKCTQHARHKHDNSEAALHTVHTMGNRVQGKPRQEGDKGSSSGAVSGNDLEAALQPTDLDFKVSSQLCTVPPLQCESQPH